MAFNKHKFKHTRRDNKKPKKKEHYLDKFTGRKIEVRYDDVNGAIRRLKKVLEKMDFQKELSKREHYEKPSVKRKRMKDQAKKRAKKEIDNMIAKGEYMPTAVTGQKYLKGKREKRKAWVAKERIRRLRDRGK
jgi:small subunit ribosomal protein S21